VAHAVAPKIKRLFGGVPGRTNGQILAPLGRVGRIAEVDEVLLRRGTVAQRVVDHLTHPGHIFGMMFRRPHAERGAGHEAVQLDEKAIQR
jgi:hypothetical protein